VLTAIGVWESEFSTTTSEGRRGGEGLMVASSDTARLGACVEMAEGVVVLVDVVVEDTLRSFSGWLDGA